MAIQLNDRDHLIFKLIDEHQVLLEKHISWFISGDDKPVLIRDRLRKLFYLDYLLCHRHGTKLPWWTTPTKPLVYMLSQMTRNIAGCEPTELDLFDAEVQRHLLEVANLRMLHLMDVRDGRVSDFSWMTYRAGAKETALDAKVTFKFNGTEHRLGIVNHPTADQSLIAKLETALKSESIQSIFIVNRDDAHQKALQAIICSSPTLANRCMFATHHELYKSGIVNTKWQASDLKLAQMFVIAVAEPQAFVGGMAIAPAM